MEHPAMSARAFAAVIPAAFFMAGCAGSFSSDYAEGIAPETSRDWRVTDVRAIAHDSRSVSEDNILVPSADIVWHGEPPGDRRAQVAAIVAEGVREAAEPLDGPRPVEIHVAVDRFHGVTPVAINRSPGGVHDIIFRAAVVDRDTREVLVEPVRIDAALVAYTQRAAILSRMNGETERRRIVDHVADVAAGWLGTGPDVRGSFTSIGR
jgi:hypothetical protein